MSGLETSASDAHGRVRGAACNSTAHYFDPRRAAEVVVASISSESGNSTKK
jgi:hypothetical protein